MEGRKPSGLMETMDIMDPIPYVGSVHYITQDFALSGVLYVVRSRADMDGIGPLWDDISDWIKPLSSKGSVASILARLVLIASYGVLYLERKEFTLPPKRTSTSAALAMNQAAIRQLIDDRVAAALEAQAANMANTGNTNRNPEQAPVARKLFSRSNCTEDCKVKFAAGTLTEKALSWWNLLLNLLG
nr:reverse transcriptase domain-containing protein [Tanacetum cinerariifolium]